MKKTVIAAIAAGIIVAVVGGLWYYSRRDTGENYETKLARLSPSITATQLQDVQIDAWIAWWDEENSLKSLDNNNNHLKTIMPMWYRLNRNGEMEEISESKKRVTIEEKAKALDIRIMPTITNDFDPDATSSLLDAEEKQLKIIDDMIDIAKTNGYLGWDVDWEEMYPGDRGGFSYFVRELSTKMHENNLKLSITVQARTDEITENPATKAQDWRVIGANADEVRIMAYDFHYDESEPGAVTPLDKLEKVIAVAKRELPPEKIVMGLPTYGYKWGGAKGMGVQYNEALAVLENAKAEAKRDPESAALRATFREGETMEMWFEDAESTRVKIMLCKAAGINKFSLWRLGGEDVGIWGIR